MTSIPVGTAKTIPVDADRFALVDSADSNQLKDLTWANLVAELSISLDQAYGEMYMYESVGGQTVGITDEYYALDTVYSAGDLHHWTLVAGKNGTGDITTVGGIAININNGVTPHGLLTGDYVNIQSTNHSSTAIVTRIDADNFTLPIPFGGNEGCTWQMGDYLLAGAGAAGKYILNFSITASAGAAVKQYKFETVQNATHLEKCAFEIATSGTNHQSGMSSCIVTVAEGDRIWSQFKNETDTQDLDYEHSNLNLARL